LIDERRELLALADKYERMSALRATLGRGTPSTSDRERLRALAREFPGALRELDTIDDAELARRLAAAKQAEPAPWLRWMAAYHALMRRALALRSGASSELDNEFADAIRAPRHGRMNVVVFEALARRFALPVATLWDALFPSRGDRGGRSYRP
jgi:hypothetical protein